MRRQVIFLLLIFGSQLFGDANSETFSKQAWRKIEPIYEAIRQHPFNEKLADGTLRKDRFDYYSGQDVLYLTEFAKALSILATKLDNPAQIRKVSKFAIDCLVEEKAVQEKFSSGVKREMAPATFFYTNFLLATAAYRSREELAAALLPCFWIYLRVAQDLKEKANPNSPYLHLIKMYSSLKYKKSIEYMISLTDQLAGQVSSAEKAKMLEAFVTASRLEWYFWEASYQMDAWKPDLISTKNH